MRRLRWALVPVAAAVAWFASTVVGALLLQLATELCPESEMVSGLCGASWWPFAEAVVLCLSAATAAASIVIACSLTAPAHRSRVAVVVFVAGAVWAAVLAIAAGEYPALASALVAGVLAVWWIRRRTGTRTGNRHAKV
jgi:hypothetical protein